MPTTKGPPPKSERPPSPVKRKKSLARSASAVQGSPTPRARQLHAHDDPTGGSLGTPRNIALASSKKPPRAPASHDASIHSSSSQAESSCEATPRPSSPAGGTSGFAAASSAGIGVTPRAGKEKERVRVFVRMRPMREDEGESTLRLDNTGRRLWMGGDRVSDQGSLPSQFDYDGVLQADVTQQHVYETVARPLVEAAIAGFSACLMCYGQTGTGKTFTFGGGDCLKGLVGSSSSARSGGSGKAEAAAATAAAAAGGGAAGRKAAASAAAAAAAAAAAKEAEQERQRLKREDRKLREGQKARQGVVGRALHQVLEWATPRGQRVCMAYVQVYMELLQDLLRPESTLSLREHPDLGVYVDGALWKTITSAEAACAEVATADTRRATAFTRLNADSSRSHAVLMIAIRGPADSEPELLGTAPDMLASARMASSASDVAWASARGRLFLVDLAGSERTKRSGVVGQSFEEACSINQSLTTLGRCIGALASKNGGGTKRAPVRESKLTRLLSPCLGGATTTSLVCCVSGAAADRFETQSTLEFGANAMRILLKPQSQLGVDFKALTIELQAQLDARVQPIHEIEAAVEARVRAEFARRLAELEAARREAVAAQHSTQMAFERRAGSEKAAEERAAVAAADLKRISTEAESTAKMAATSRASHDSRAAIIATADSLAEEVVRARRERDEALTQLEQLSVHLAGGMSSLAMLTTSGGSAILGGPEPANEPRLPEGASALEREVAGGLAEIAILRTQIDRRKVRARASAARMVPDSLGGGVSSALAGSAAAEAAVASDRRALQSLRTASAGLLGGLSEMIAGAVELGETQHPDLWQGTPEQLQLVDQIRAAQRLVHMLGRLQGDFQNADVEM